MNKIGSVLITGANRGLGLEFVKQLLDLPKPPTIIFAACRDPSKAEELKKVAASNSNVVKILELDVKKQDTFPTLREKLQQEIGETGLNLLINNAGIMIQGKVDDVTKEAMMDCFEVNTVSPLLLAKELLPLLKKAASKSKSGDLSACRSGIVNVTSKMGSMEDNTSGGSYPYRTSKTALNMVTKSLSVDLKNHGILVYAQHPGWVLTDMGGKNALIDTKTSVEGMINVIMTSKEEHAGLMLNYDGKKIPW